MRQPNKHPRGFIFIFFFGGRGGGKRGKDGFLFFFVFPYVPSLSLVDVSQVPYDVPQVLNVNQIIVILFFLQND
jgi:hypothetical protein